jgi:hypothetical protein
MRWSSILEEWVRMGHEVEVVSGHPSADSAEFTRNGVKVFAAAGLGDLRTQIHATRTGWFRRQILRVLRFVYGLTWRNIQWPDYACLWVRPAVRVVRDRIEAFKPDCLISVSHPFSGHLVGYLIKRRHPSLPWYVDIGDPFSFLEHVKVNNSLLYRQINKSVERKVLTQAEGISVTTEGTRQRYEELWPATALKIEVMPPLLRGRAEDFWRPTLLAKGGAQKWIFLGTLYPGLRSPDLLIKFFENYVKRYPHDPISLHFFGEYRQCASEILAARALLGNRLVLHGSVPEEESRRQLLAADGLLHIGNHTPMQLPSKVVEYAATGKRILNFYSIENDSSREFFSAHPRVWQVGPNDDGIEIMGKIHEGEPESLADRSAIVKFVRPFERARVAEQYLTHIRSVL